MDDAPQEALFEQVIGLVAKVQVLGYLGDGKYLILTPRKQKIIAHRANLSFLGRSDHRDAPKHEDWIKLHTSVAQVLLDASQRLRDTSSTQLTLW